MASSHDASVRGLAILWLAAEKYHRDDYLAAIAYLERYGQACGKLSAECSFLSLKAQAREAQSEQLQGIDKNRSQRELGGAEQGFRKLFNGLPKDHYLRKESLLWVALVEGWNGNRTTSRDSLHKVVAMFPGTDVATIARDALGSDREVSSE